MIVVAPGYLNEKSLPYASVIFYHNQLLYFLPTGFHPIELKNVGLFPEFCRSHGIAMPQLLWTMCDLYFQNSKSASDCINILEPFRKKHVVIAMASYPRDRTAINAAQRLLLENPRLLSTFEIIDLDFRLLAREILSHVLYEIFIEEGYKGAIDYFRANASTPDQFIRLAAATLLNRFKIFAGHETKILVYEQTWYPFFQAFASVSGDIILNDDAQQVEHFRYKLFEAILLPIFGKCDSKRKSEFVVKTASQHAGAITGLKNACEKVARKVVLLPTESNELKQKVLAEELQKQITEPLSSFISKPHRDVLNLIRKFSLDSTVIGGLLAITQGVGWSEMAIAAAAGAVATGIKYLISEELVRPEHPSELFVAGMKKACINEES